MLVAQILMSLDWEGNQQQSKTAKRRTCSCCISIYFYVLCHEFWWYWKGQDSFQIYLFRAMGKHKYATHMIKFLTDIHFVYPKGLWRMIWYNMLMNPTGIPNMFHGVDWVVELLNLFTKASRTVLLHYTCLTARTACFWRTGFKLLKRSCSERVSTCWNLP